MPDNLVSPMQPQAQAQAQAQVQPQAQPQDQDQDQDQGQDQQPQLPPELTNMPAFHGLLAGAPPAVSVVVKEFKHNPVAKEIESNLPALQAAGFGFYRSQSGHLAVMFNRFHIHPQDIQAADKAGKLQVLAPPLEQVNHALSKTGTRHLLMGAKVPAAFASPTPQAAPQAGAQAAQAAQAGGGVPMPPQSSRGPSAGVERRLLGARLQNMQPGAPTSGAAPGGGRLLNSVLKQVV